MIKSVNNYPVSQLFDIDGNVVYAIPRYQREYTWGKWQWEALFDDVLESDPGYFLGSIICINQSTDALAVQRLEVVDGQQRLTTLSLLFAAVYHALKKHEAQLDEDQHNELFNLKRKLVLRRGDDQIRVIPQVQNHNNSDYRSVLSEIKVISHCPALAYAGNRKIFRAFRYFQERLEMMADGQGSVLSATVSFLGKLNQTSLVKIEVLSHADAYILFESLNNRGMPLTPIDLIKNKLLARLESVEPGKIDHYFGHWNRLLGHLGDDYGVQERFFRQYYNAFREDLKAVYQVPIATRSNLIQIYEKLINHDAKDCLQRIGEAGQLYARLLSRGQDGTQNGLEKSLKDLDRIQGAPSYLLMLHLLVRQAQLGVSESHLAEITRLLVRFFVRRNLTDTPPTRDLNRLFMSIIDKLAGQLGVAVVSTIRKELVTVSADDDAFRQKLEGSIYEENSWVTRFVLCTLAEQGMTRETWVDLWRFENQQFVWTIEHIFPQGEDIPVDWANMIANGDRAKAEEYQELYVHKLGNLTIRDSTALWATRAFLRSVTARTGTGILWAIKMD